MPDDESVSLLYERTGAKLHFKLTNMTNHEIQEVLIGVIARMERDDLEDFCASLLEYVPMIRRPNGHPDVVLSKIAAAVAQRPELSKPRRSKERR